LSTGGASKMTSIAGKGRILLVLMVHSLTQAGALPNSQPPTPAP
jgi:hypothetical protein